MPSVFKNHYTRSHHRCMYYACMHIHTRMYAGIIVAIRRLAQRRNLAEAKGKDAVHELRRRLIVGIDCLQR